MSDAATSTQDYAHHKNVPRLFLAVSAVLLLDEARRLWAAVDEPGWGTAWDLLVGLALLALCLNLRVSALRLQDRLIRAEMRARLERLLGRERHADIVGLRLAHLIALRFAADHELPELFEAVLRGELTTQDAIKRRISDWQADLLRV